MIDPQRLRDLAEVLDELSAFDVGESGAQLCRDAADELEATRAELARVKSIAEQACRAGATACKLWEAEAAKGGA